MSAMQLQLGAVAATADADGLLCLAAVADSAAQQLASAMAASAASGGAAQPAQPAKPRRPRAPTQPRALALTVGRLRLEQPLCEDRDVAVEVSSVHAVLGTQRGTHHSVHSAGAVLSMRGKPIIQYRQLEATLRLPEAGGTGGARLPVQPLAQPWPAAAAQGADGVNGAPAGAAAGAEPEPASSLEAYERARLEAWLDADAATSPATAPADAVAAAALGAGPASILDAHIRRVGGGCTAWWARQAGLACDTEPGHHCPTACLPAGRPAGRLAGALPPLKPSCPHSRPRSGAELIVPHDGEPGPTERYCELYAKALETVGGWEADGVWGDAAGVARGVPDWTHCCK